MNWFSLLLLLLLLSFFSLVLFVGEDGVDKMVVTALIRNGTVYVQNTTESPTQTVTLIDELTVS